MKTEFYYPKNLWIVLGNDKKQTVVHATQEMMEEAVRRDLIMEYNPLKILKVKELGI